MSFGGKNLDSDDLHEKSRKNHTYNGDANSPNNGMNYIFLCASLTYGNIKVLSVQSNNLYTNIYFRHTK